MYLRTKGKIWKPQSSITKSKHESQSVVFNQLREYQILESKKKKKKKSQRVYQV